MHLPHCSLQRNKHPHVWCWAAMNHKHADTTLSECTWHNHLCSMMATLMDRNTSKDAHGMPSLSTTCSLGNPPPPPQGGKTTTNTAKHHDQDTESSTCQSNTNNGHWNNWIDIILNKSLWYDIVESWFKVACVWMQHTGKCLKVLNGYIMSISTSNRNSQIQITLSIFYPSQKNLTHTFISIDAATKHCTPSPNNKWDMIPPLYLKMYSNNPDLKKNKALHPI